MTRAPTDALIGRAAGGRKEASAESPSAVLEALAIQLGKLAAERDFARTAGEEDKWDADGLFSPTGESVR
jgi:hypothetical protein